MIIVDRLLGLVPGLRASSAPSPRDSDVVRLFASALIVSRSRSRENARNLAETRRPENLGTLGSGIASSVCMVISQDGCFGRL